MPDELVADLSILRQANEVLKHMLQVIIEVF